MLIASVRVMPRLEKIDSASAFTSGLTRILIVAVFAMMTPCVFNAYSMYYIITQNTGKVTEGEDIDVN
jgi:hypothetical protein